VNIRVNYASQEFLAGGELKFVHPVIFEGKFCGFAVKALDLAAVQLLEQIRVVAGDQINQMPCKRFVLGERLRVGDRSFCEFRIAVSLFRETSEKCCGVIIHFLAKHFIHGDRKSAGEKDRCGSASACSGRHSCDVRGQQNEETSGSAARAGGRYKHRDGHRGIQNVMNHIRHRIAEAARRIHGDQHERGLAAGRVGEAFINIRGEDRLDDAIEFQLKDKWRILHIGC
jgi:hypothetical protein